MAVEEDADEDGALEDGFESQESKSSRRSAFAATVLLLESMSKSQFEDDFDPSSPGGGEMANGDFEPVVAPPASILFFSFGGRLSVDCFRVVVFSFFVVSTVTGMRSSSSSSAPFEEKSSKKSSVSKEEPPEVEETGAPVEEEAYADLVLLDDAKPLEAGGAC